MRLGMLMGRMALDWTLSRRLTVDLEHHPRHGRSALDTTLGTTRIHIWTIGKEFRIYVEAACDLKHK